MKRRLSRSLSRAKRNEQQRSKSRRRRLSAETLENRLVLDSTVVFNELMYNPPTDIDESGEWIEFYNQLAVDMDISEWRLDGAVEYTFPDNTIVPGRGYILVSSNTTVDGAASGVEIVGPYSGKLANSGETVELYNNDNRLMNTISYNDKGDWPVEPDGSGSTLAKRRELSGSELFENWTHSPEVGGTPGEANFESDSIGGPAYSEIVADDPPVTAHVPSDGSLGTSWQQIGFDDSGWLSGNAGVGYETGNGYDPHINLDVETEMDNVNTSIYIRTEFTNTIDPDDMEALVIQMKYDDGFVAYLNGTEVASANRFASITWNTNANGSHADGEAVVYQDFSITSFKDLLNVGNNVLAIQGLNTNITSSDFLISPKLSYLPAEDGGGGPVFDGPIPLAISEVSPLAGNKFVEIENFNSAAIDLTGMVLRTTGDNGGDYTFPAQSIAAGGRLVLTEADLGVTMEDNEHFFLYTSDLETVIDGRPITNSLRGLTDDGQWIYPDLPTPDAANSFDLNEDIVINEIFYHAQPAQLDTDTTVYTESDEEWIELYNRGTSPVVLTGWQLNDAIDFEIPAGTILQPGGYLVVARDPVALAQKYNDISIVGPFSGKLSNSADRIVLEDANSNPADVVHYHEGGQWNSTADGGGSSLELVNPFSDNSIGGAWAASDESGKASWNSYTGTKRSTEPLGIGRNFHEFIFGMLQEGEVLIDNLSVQRAGIEMIANGSFESTNVGSAPAGWRFIGNHDTGTVITDPDDQSNKVLHLVADGAQQHIHDHVEITFAGGQTIQDGQNYTVSFDAKWINGSRQMNTRLYFTRASQTFVLDAPHNNGTPGAQNSQYAATHGPTYTEFSHSPVLPSANEPVTVSVQADAPQGVASMTLYYNQNGGASTQVPMTLSNGVYSAVIPGQSSGQVIQFYVQGTDNTGAVTTFPADGAESRALYEVNDGQGTSRAVETFRIVLTSADNNHLFSSADRMSNHYLRGTLIIGDHTAFHDVGIRQVGSRFIRPNSGYKIKFNPDQKFLDVHESIRFDINALGEILMKQMVNRAGGSEVSMYDDISYMISPQHNGRTMLLNLARYESIYLTEQFGPDGTDGTKFELDDITYPTNGNGPNNEKTGTGVDAQDIRYRGDDLEFYRGQLLIKNNRAKDDFEPLVEFARVINLNGAALDAELDNVMDVDLWMRHYATQSYLGNWDTYGFRRPKNLRIYIRPSDGKVIPLFWDADLANFNESFIYNGGSSRLDEIRNRPQNERLFWGHMWDLTNRSFNSEYVTHWTSHYGSLGAGTASANTINNRTNSARSQAQSAIPMVDFEITSNNGNPTTSNQTTVDLVGDGWIDVREIRLAGSDIPLNVKWTDDNSWTIPIPISNGLNNIELEAFDFEGNLVGTDSIAITGTAVQTSVRDALRVTEVNYHPSNPTTAELTTLPTAVDDSFEYIEFANVGTSSISLSGVSITSPFVYEFPAVNLAVGQHITVARSLDGFGARYSAAFPIGEWGEAAGNLPNSGGMITIVDDTSTIVQSFSYDDSGDWPSLADGDGFSLQAIDYSGDYNDPNNWLPSRALNGSPGVDATPVASPVGLRISEVHYHEADETGGEFVEIFNDSNTSIPLTGVRFIEGVNFDFTAGAINSLAPGDSVLVVSSVAEFTNFYGAGFPVAGEFTSGSLSNSGERIILVDAAGNAINDFVYDDAAPWPVAADGNGSSLEVISTSDDYSDASNWRASIVGNGTPGTTEIITPLDCDYVGGVDGCDLDDLDALYAGSDTGGATITFTSGGMQATVNGTIIPIPADAIAENAALDGGYIFQMTVTTPRDLLIVDASLSVAAGSFHNETANASDANPPADLLLSLFPTLKADSWVTTPGNTSAAGLNVLDAFGTLVSHFDLTDNGAQTDFQFGQITLLPDANGNASATIFGEIRTASEPEPVVDNYSYTFTIAPADNQFDYNGDGVVDAGDIPGWLADASNPDNPANPGNLTYVIGDVNLDGTVDSTDLGLLLNNFGAEAPTAGAGVGWRGGDLNMDGTVDSTDLGQLLNNFGFESVSATLSSSPLPIDKDVNRDGVVSPLDALRVINYINSPITDASLLTAAEMSAMDVDGSGDIAPLDALLVLNRVNQTAALSQTSIDSLYADLDGEEDKDDLDPFSETFPGL